MDDFPPDADSIRTRKFFSRVLVIVLFLWIAGFGLVGLYRSLQPETDVVTVISPFKPWDGEWTGEITVTDSEGKVIRRAAQRRTYRHVLSDKDFRQEGHFYEATPDGEEELESQMNSMDFKFRVLKRKAIRRNGSQTIDYVGNVEDGKLVWAHRVFGAAFVLREWVEGDAIHIEGEEKITEADVEKTYTVKGLFRRVSSDDSKADDTKPMDAPATISDNSDAKSNDAQTTMSEVAQ